MTMTARLLVGALTDFVLTVTATLTGAMAANGSIVMPGQAVWLLAILFGLGAAAKHVRGMLIDPKVIVLVLAIGLTGCSVPASMLRELAKDNASACLHVKAVLYGTATLCRTNTAGQALLGVKDGDMQIRHEGGK